MYCPMDWVQFGAVSILSVPSLDCVWDWGILTVGRHHLGKPGSRLNTYLVHIDRQRRNALKGL